MESFLPHTLSRGEGDPQGRERNGEMVDVLGSTPNGICARIPLPSASLTPSPRGKGLGAVENFQLMTEVSYGITE